MSNEKVTEQEDIRYDKKIIIRSIAPWTTGARRITTLGDISIPPNGTARMTREEAISQAQSGNILIVGIDGLGSHATWYIEDDVTRQELSFDTNTTKQEFLSIDKVKHCFDLKTRQAFENNIKNIVKTRAEKAFLMECIKKLKINDYEKIAFCSDYTGIRLA